MMHDIAVIGGGLTGLMTATALSHACDRVMLVERGSGAITAGDDRTTTINAAGARMLTALGVWDRLDTAPAPIRRLAVAEGAPPSGLAARRRPAFELTWDSADTPMGYVVGNAALHAALAAAAQDRQVDILRECALSSRRHLGDTTEMELLGHDGSTEQRRAALVIACDGAQKPPCRGRRACRARGTPHPDRHRRHSGGADASWRYRLSAVSCPAVLSR